MLKFIHLFLKQGLPAENYYNSRRVDHNKTQIMLPNTISSNFSSIVGNLGFITFK